jgi:peptidoglycan/LPS O-acetylase OafA/YrhL
MSATHQLFAIAALVIAAAAAWLIGRITRVPLPHKYSSLDGLRGILAMLVVVNHAANWRLYAQTGVWTLPPSRLYGHFGQSSVALFFMITAFLFVSKLLAARERPIDWLRLYVSRGLRLIPLYVFFVGALVVVAMIASRFTLHVSAGRAGLQTAHWLAFAVRDMPPINGLDAPVIASAAWSLPYEWWFYFALPVLALLVGAGRPVLLLLASAGATALASVWITSRGGWPIAAVFTGGCLAALLVRQPRMRTIARHPASTVVALFALLLVTRTPVEFDAGSTALLALAFVLIACGNTLAGVLTSTPMLVLGEISYSIYLLHGIVLYVAFSAVGAAAQLTVLQHWLVVYGAVMALVGLSRITFNTIEAPAMAAVDATTAQLRAMRAAAPAKAPAMTGK